MNKKLVICLISIFLYFTSSLTYSNQNSDDDKSIIDEGVKYILVTAGKLASLSLVYGLASNYLNEHNPNLSWYQKMWYEKEIKNTKETKEDILPRCKFLLPAFTKSVRDLKNSKLIEVVYKYSKNGYEYIGQWGDLFQTSIKDHEATVNQLYR